MEEYVADIEFHKTLILFIPALKKLDSLGLDSKGRRKLLKAILEKLGPNDIPENLPDHLLSQL